jgi:dUTP pyrophosphatase
MEKNDLDDLNKSLESIDNLFSKDLSNEEDNEDIDLSSMFSNLGFSFEDLEKGFDEYQPTMPLRYSTSNVDAVDPEYAYPTDSGFDLYSTEEITIESFGRALIPTGLHFDIPDGYEIQVRSKSGLALKQGLMVLNSPGTVDCFSENMKILTTDGEKTINEIKIGEIVYSFNEETLEIEKDIISQIFDTEKQEILIIETESGILEVTSNTEVYTTKGIVLAKNLTENDEIINFF